MLDGDMKIPPNQIEHVALFNTTINPSEGKAKQEILPQEIDNAKKTIGTDHKGSAQMHNKCKRSGTYYPFKNC